MSAIIKTDKPVHYLLGEQAARCYSDYGIEKAMEQSDIEGFDFQVVTITDGMLFDDALFLMDGYFGWTEITDEAFNIVMKLKPDTIQTLDHASNY